MTGTSEIRRVFLQYFAERNHEILPSSNLVTRDNPTLMFANAGMVQFRERFTEEISEATSGEIPYRPVRVATAQKCLRAGGKHNDLDQVGHTARHHTFFEMLGNFSFGDYFKEHAIFLSWELITQGYGLDPGRLLVTVHDSDEEARALWRKIAGISESRIVSISGSDNYWTMGDTGPCGPCSEIFFDHGEHIPGGPPGSEGQDLDRFVEIWNLVFMQEFQHEDGTQTPLKRQSIDTGMGLERIAAVLQGTHDNYGIDIFRNLIFLISHHTGKESSVHHRIIADHLRSACFLVAEGLLPGNEGQAYVLRRILRRAIRHCQLLEAENLLSRLVPDLVIQTGPGFPELQSNMNLIQDTLDAEEAKFAGALRRGMRKLQKDLEKLGENQPLPGRTAFQLFETFGIPLDLIQDILRQENSPREVDVSGFEEALRESRDKSRRRSQK